MTHKTKRRPATKKEAKIVADRAEARSRGEDVAPPPTPLDPPVFHKKRLKRGRPTKYTPALGRAIRKMLASGMTVQAVCRRPRMPHERRLREWASDPEHPFSPQYEAARLVGYHKMADEIIDIADSGTVKDIVDPTTVQRDRLRIDTRKWLLAKALPKIYGDKIIAEHTGKDGGPIQTQDTPRPTGEDHLEGLAKRFAGGGLKVIEGGKPKGQ